MWARAVAEASRRSYEAAARGEPITPDLLGDVWTSAATQVAQKIVEDPAFAAITGRSVNAMMSLREEARVRQSQRVRESGFAAHADVDEVGRRLVDLERRMHELTVLLRDEVLPVVRDLRERAPEAEGAKKGKKGTQ